MSAVQAPAKNLSTDHCESEPRQWYENDTFLLWMGRLEKITLLALVALAFYTDPELCGYFVAGGFVLGIALNWDRKTPPNCKKVTGCTQGFLEQLTGVRLPQPLSLAANVAITICHLEEHGHVFIPLIGLNFGWLLGKLTGEHLPEFYRDMKARITGVPRQDLGATIAV